MIVVTKENMDCGGLKRNMASQQGEPVSRMHSKVRCHILASFPGLETERPGIAD